MRLWGRSDDDADDRDEEYPDDADAGDEGEGDAEEGAGGDAEPDPAEQARTQAAVQAALTEERGRIRQAAQKRGLDFTGDDFGVVDYGRASQSFGFGQQQQERQQPRQEPQAREEDDPEPEIEDWNADSYRRYAAWQARQATKGVQAENAQLRAMLAEDRLSRAVERVEEAVKRYAIPGVAEYLEHPDFEETFRQVIQSTSPASWSNARNLAAMASLAAMELDRERLPKKEPAATERRGPTAGELARRQLDQASPSRDAGGFGEREMATRHRRTVGVLANHGIRVSAAEAEVLDSSVTEDVSFDAYQRFKKAQQKGRGR